MAKKQPSATPNRNMGRIQKAQAGWRDHGDGAGLRGPEVSERQEREARGKPMLACYRILLGPTPTLMAGDRYGAKLFLDKIEHAVDVGGWTRSEGTRLRRMRDKWKARAAGLDPWFEVNGNRGGATNDNRKGILQLRRAAEGVRGVIDRAKRGEFAGD